MVPDCSPGHDASIGIQNDLPRSHFEVDLTKSLSTILFLTTSGDLNIYLIKTLFTKLVGLSANHQAPFAFCRHDSWFQDLKGGRKAPPDSEPFRARPE